MYHETKSELASKKTLYSRHTECEVLALGRIRESTYASTSYQIGACQTVSEGTEQRR